MEKPKKISKNTFKTPAEGSAKTKPSRTFVFSFAWNQKHREILSFAIFIFAIFSLISFISHLTGALNEYSLQNQSIEEGYFPTQNIGGFLGHYLANLFITNGFGAFALLIPVWLMYLCVVLYLNKGWHRLNVAFLYMTFMLYAGSWFMGLITLWAEIPIIDYAGAIGITWVEVLTLYVGLFGAAGLWCVLMFFFVSYHLQGRFAWANRLFLWTKTSATTTPQNTQKKNIVFKNPQTEETKQSEPPQSHQQPTPDDIKQKENNSTETEITPTKSLQASNLLEDELGTKEPIQHSEPTPKNKTTSEISFEIEQGVKEMPVIALQTDEVFTNITQQEESFVKVVPEEDQPTLEGDEEVGDWELYDPTKDLSQYQYPTIDLLNFVEPSTLTVDREELEENKNKIVKTLLDYKIEITHIKATVGPTVTLYEIIPAPGVKISKIKGLEDDIALSLAALGIRIIAPIPGKGTIGIEIPNSKPEIVPFRSVIATEKFRDTQAELPIILGKTISNEVFIADLTKMPHLLVAGATGQGKSVGLNGIITSILYKKHPSQVKFVLIDPKKVELSLFQSLENHFLAKLPTIEDSIITDTKQVVAVLSSLCQEMDDRYELLKMASVRNIKEYNQKFINRKLNPKHGHRFLPYIILIIDELADLMMTAGKEVEMPIARLAQLARAIGIHLVVATQRPSVNVITGIIKANFPARLSFRVISKVDSRTILDTNGAEQLIGRGDLLFSDGSNILRIQNPFIDTKEVENIVEHIAKQKGYPEPYFLPEVKIDNDDAFDEDFDEDGGMRDTMFEEAARLVVKHQHGSTSLIQRRLKLGYNRAGRIMDQLEKAGIVGPANGSKPREVLVNSEQELEKYL